MLTGKQVKVILILLDNKGHAEWELAEYLKMEDSNLNPILKKLEGMKIICQGAARKSRKQQKKKEGDYKEFPYYLADSIDALKTLVGEIVHPNPVYESWFVFDIFRRSNYLESMRQKFKDDVDRSIVAVLRKKYPAYKNGFLKILLDINSSLGLEPPVEPEHYHNQEVIPWVEMVEDLEIRSWYSNYLQMRSDEDLRRTS